MAALNMALSTYPSSAIRQGGSAIISALLTVAIVAVIAAGMLTRQSVMIRTVEAEQSRIQNSAALMAGLDASRMLLWDSRRKSRAIHPGQAWAQPLGQSASDQPEEGFHGQLEDQQGKFNLRNLLRNGQLEIGQLRSFERLCQMISISDVLCQSISQRVLGSYTRFSTPATGQVSGMFASGRETSSATRKPIPASSVTLRSLDDLQGMQGLSDQVLERLKRYVCILPANTWVNSNTASAEVLAAVVPGLSLPSAQTVVAERDRGQWFAYRLEIIARMQVPTQAADGLEIGVASDWFVFRGKARRDGRQARMEALLYVRDDSVPRVIWSRIGA